MHFANTHCFSINTTTGTTALTIFYCQFPRSDNCLKRNKMSKLKVASYWEKQKKIGKFIVPFVKRFFKLPQTTATELSQCFWPDINVFLSIFLALKRT